jgi:hypothetical protein
VKQTDVVVVASTPFVSGSVRHLGLCRLTSDSDSAHRRNSVQRASWVHESIGPVEPISLLVEPHGVNVHLPAALVCQDEGPWDSAFNLPHPSRASTLRRRGTAVSRTKWGTRIPATLSETQAVLLQADPQAMAPLTEGYGAHVARSSYGGVEQRWVLLNSAPRQPQAQRTAGKQPLKHSEQEVKAFKKLCRTAFVCAADTQ